jgi:hypothetical protein
MQRIRLILLLALFPAAAVIGGIVLGQWLAMRAPVDQAAAAAAAANGPVDISSLPLANGTGVPEPPQPRMDGSRGVPPRVVASSKPIPTVSANGTTPGTAVPPGTGVNASLPPGTGVNPSSSLPPAVAGMLADPSLNISTKPYVAGSAPPPGTPAPPTSSVSGWIPQSELNQTRQGGFAQVVPVDADDDDSGPQSLVTQYSNAPAPQSVSVSSRPPAAANVNANMPAWQRVLRIALDRCESQGSGRSNCVQQARNNYCEANQGWGTVPECGP